MAKRRGPRGPGKDILAGGRGAYSGTQATFLAHLVPRLLSWGSRPLGACISKLTGLSWQEPQAG